jgi:hypothetical protein
VEHIRRDITDMQKDQDDRIDRWLALQEHIRQECEDNLCRPADTPSCLEWARRWRPDLLERYWKQQNLIVEARREIALLQALVTPDKALDAEFEQVNELALRQLGFD